MIVVGTEGAGKSSILGSLAGMKIVSMGTEMLKLADKERGVEDRDKLRTLGLKDIAKWRAVILKDLMAMEGDIILDTHTTIKFGMGYLPGLIPSDFEMVKGSIVGLLYINANTTDIINRRLSDKTRVREGVISEDEVNTYKNIEVSLSSFASAYLNIPIYMIYNMEGRLAEAQEEAKAIVRQVFG